MVDFIAEHKRCALWAGMGLGKSSGTLFALDMLRLQGEIGNAPTLVIGPMRVARDTWPEEVVKWEQFKDLRIMPLTGTPKQRADKLKIKADIYTISYESVPWLVAHFMEKWPFRQVIADESDRLKGFRLRQGGQRAHSLARVTHNLTDRWVNLTGTPSPNGLKDLWGQTWYLDRGARLGASFNAFERRWFAREWNGFGIRPMPHADKEIHALLSDICLTVDPKDYYDLKEPIVTTIKVKLPPKARAIYKALEKDLFAEIAGHPDIEVFNAAALTNKCLQLANGAIYTEYPNWAPIHDEKIEAVRSILAEAGGMPVLLAYSFKSDLARIKTAFPRAVELSTPDGMKAFRAGDSPIGLAHPKSMGHGIDGLQNVTNILVRFGHGWNLGERMQMLERIGPMRQLQAGLDRPVFVYDIVADDTLDEDVIESHAAKRSVQDALLTAMKRRA
jgi:SNF2-related domain